MLSHKIWNDSSMVGKHWAEVSTMFTSQEVLAMEREVLLLLRYDLEVTTEEIWKTARPFMGAPWLALSKSEKERVRKCESRLAGEATGNAYVVERQEQLAP
ncbi:16537_t:CDS:1, partial [Acaulospora colombiana]